MVGSTPIAYANSASYQMTITMVGGAPSYSHSNDKNAATLKVGDLVLNASADEDGAGASGSFGSSVITDSATISRDGQSTPLVEAVRYDHVGSANGAIFSDRRATATALRSDGTRSAVTRSDTVATEGPTGVTVSLTARAGYSGAAGIELSSGSANNAKDSDKAAARAATADKFQASRTLNLVMQLLSVLRLLNAGQASIRNIQHLQTALSAIFDAGTTTPAASQATNTPTTTADNSPARAWAQINADITVPVSAPTSVSVPQAASPPSADPAASAPASASQSAPAPKTEVAHSEKRTEQSGSLAVAGTPSAVSTEPAGQVDLVRSSEQVDTINANGSSVSVDGAHAAVSAGPGGVIAVSYAQAVTATDGNVILNAAAVDKITTGTGNDIVNAVNAYDGVNLGDGNNIAQLVRSGNVTAGSGDDVLIGNRVGIANLGDGNNVAILDHANAIITGSGNDSITASDVQTVQAGAGDDTLTLARATALYSRGDGNDTVTFKDNAVLSFTDAKLDDVTVTGQRDAAGKFQSLTVAYKDGSGSVTFTPGDKTGSFAVGTVRFSDGSSHSLQSLAATLSA